MKTMIQAAVVTLFAASAAQAQQAVQWKVSEGGNGHWYRGFADRLPWAAASERAGSIGGHLATCTSASENQLVRTVRDTQCAFGGAWIGLRSLSPPSEPAGNWEWVTGEPLAWTNWLVGEPNGFDTQGAVARVVDLCCFGDSWGDANGDGLLPYVVEWSADCNHDGIVDYGQCRDGSLADYNGNNIPDCCEASNPCVIGNYPVQWRAEDGGNGHWYRMLITASPTRWEQAKLLAESIGGHLATIRSSSENAVCLAVAEGGPKVPGGSVWLGGIQPTGESSAYAWVTGEPFDWTPGCGFSNTDQGCGFEDRLTMTSPWNGCPWNDVAACWSIPALLVEWSADCNSDGIVDYGQILQGQLADANADGVPDICQVPTCRDADFFPDRNINGVDLGVLLSQWGAPTQYTVADLNHDGAVDGIDLGIFLSFWGPCPY